MELGAGRGPRTLCSFSHHWLPGQESVTSPVVVTGLQECVHRGRQCRGQAGHLGRAPEPREDQGQRALRRQGGMWAVLGDQEEEAGPGPSLYQP